MFIAIRRYGKAEPQRMSDLAALIRYILSVKEIDSDENFIYRLAGPPVTSRLIQRISPFGASINDAAYDLAQQLFWHAQESEIQGALPAEIYKQIIIGFPKTNFLNKKFKSISSDHPVYANKSDFFIIIKIIRELLDALGFGDAAPSILVVHADTDNYHAHVVLGMFAKEFNCAKVFETLNRKLVKDIAATIYAAHDWPFPSLALSRHYKKEWEVFTDHND